MTRTKEAKEGGEGRVRSVTGGVSVSGRNRVVGMRC